LRIQVSLRGKSGQAADAAEVPTLKRHAQLSIAAAQIDLVPSVGTESIQNFVLIGIVKAAGLRILPGA